MAATTATLQSFGFTQSRKSGSGIVSSMTVAGGISVTGKVVVSGLGVNDGQTNLTHSISNTSAATVPSRVTVQADTGGSGAATFTITTSTVSSSTTVTIAAGQGSGAKTATLTLDPLTVSSLSLLQRVGRSNRREAVTRVLGLYAGELERLRFEHLLACAAHGRLFDDPVAFRPNGGRAASPECAHAEFPRLGFRRSSAREASR